MKKILKLTGIFFILLFIGTLIFTIIDYFGLISIKVVSTLRFIYPVLCLFMISYRLGLGSSKKGYIEGLKMGGMIIGIFTLFILLFSKYQIKTLLYDVILLLTSTLGSMIGINRKKNNL